MTIAPVIGKATVDRDRGKWGHPGSAPVRFGRFGRLVPVIGSSASDSSAGVERGRSWPGAPIRDLIEATEVGVYHGVQLAVRWAWLCWQEPVTGKNFDHRKVWIQERLAFLAGQFAIDICSMAIMRNHIHLVIRNRPDIAGQWSDEDVARRWWNLFPGRKTEDDKPAEPEPHELAMLMADSEALTGQAPGG